MRLNTNVILLMFFIKFSTCRDFYLGMFKKNDLLISQDRLYKERIPYQYRYAKYGRTYNCPITYVRVVDRLNIGRGPRVEIIRGGLQKKYIVMRLTSPYNNPIAVNIFVGCENKKYTNTWKIVRLTTPTEAAKTTEVEKSVATEIPNQPEGTEASNGKVDADKTEGPEGPEDQHTAKAPEDSDKDKITEDPEKTETTEDPENAETPEDPNNKDEAEEDPA